jgi:hypothetical protein
MTAQCSAGCCRVLLYLFVSLRCLLFPGVQGSRLTASRAQLIMNLLLSDTRWRKHPVSRRIWKKKLMEIDTVQNYHHGKSEVLKLMRIIILFWVLAACGLVDRCQRFVETCCLHRQGLHLQPWRWRYYVSPKRWHLSTCPHGPKTRKNGTINYNDVYDKKLQTCSDDVFKQTNITLFFFCFRKLVASVEVSSILNLHT